MSLTAFTGPVGTFTQQQSGASGSYSDLGLAVLGQTIVLGQAGDDTNVNAVLYLPQTAQILDFLIDNVTQWNSGTSATLSIGTAAAGTQYVGSVNAKTAGRQAPTYTSAQLTAMANVTTNVGVFITITVVGATSAGSTRVTIRYIQN